MTTISDILKDIEIPKVMKIKQEFNDKKVDHIEKELYKQFLEKNIKSNIKKGRKIAITAGSRGISKYKEIMKVTVDFVKECGGEPFLVPSMGSHGGATGMGQVKVLNDLGITEEYIGAKILSSMDVIEIGKTEKNLPVYIDKNAYYSDGIILLNRIKMHTSFRGKYESGLIKMLAIGLAKRKGADMTHRLRYENMAENIISVGKVCIDKLNIIGAVATIENGYNQVSDIFVLNKYEILEKEPKILEKSKHIMAKIYLDEIDVLIVKEIGKDISGTGMDTNIVGRFHTNAASGGPKIIKLGLLDISEKSDGNANGMGLADFISKKLYNKIDFQYTYLNAITSTEPNSVKVPMVLNSDKEVFQACIKLCGKLDISEIKMVIIENTKNLNEVFMSEAAFKSISNKNKVKITSNLINIEFDKDGNCML
ncbi:lactate racemase domain-containing protein [Romboutsia sp. 1001713B170207_170306_H8]|uniref:lactate racemase domain-containing protein n=1 Tax=Romboutsia sp. 1001713B170207_170306_H8 TaxID=2787112 RepID=UPI000821649F|nr:lactate racemase domain-containing protein [Romboutsia sp. 1001713B170207_170306_H8]SCH63543.1 Uncharacterized Fe-S center protein [uncultured Clostridium sp.]